MCIYNTVPISVYLKTFGPRTKKSFSVYLQTLSNTQLLTYCESNAPTAKLTQETPYRPDFPEEPLFVKLKQPHSTMHRQWSIPGRIWPSDKGVIEGTTEEMADQLGKQPVNLVEAILTTGIIVGGVKRLDRDKFELDTSRLPLIATAHWANQDW
jgi:hypothetical protein